MKRVLVLAAHIGDFVWRSGGAIAKYAKEGADIGLIVLSYGMRGESNEYWKREGATLQEGKKVRHAEGAKAAELLGVRHMEVLDYDDYPLELTRERMDVLCRKIREFQPDIIMTHDSQRDLYNVDHTLVGEKIFHICSMACAKGISTDGAEAVARPAIYGFEPHVSEICSFEPRLYVDITEVFELKQRAMAVYETQKQMYGAYINRSRLRGMQTGKAGCVYAEAFSYKFPITKEELLVQ